MTTFFDQEVSEIIRLRDEKYAKWEWNYGHSPKFEMTREGRFPGGTLEVTLEVKKGVIEKIRIYGDFFGTMDISTLESMLTGIVHNEEAINEALHNLDIHDYMINITKEDLLGLLI